jgi:hypothetical protein
VKVSVPLFVPRVTGAKLTPIWQLPRGGIPAAQPLLTMLNDCPVVCSAETTSLVVLLLLCSVTDFVATLPVWTFLNFTDFGATVS